MARDCGEKGVLKVLILKEQSAKNKNASDGIGGGILYRAKNSTFLKIVKGKIVSFRLADSNGRAINSVCSLEGTFTLSEGALSAIRLKGFDAALRARVFLPRLTAKRQVRCSDPK
jgi:hypothetical protein